MTSSFDVESVLILCDGDFKRGTGHVMRMLTLGREFVLRGAAVEIACHQIPEVLEKRAEMFGVILSKRVFAQESLGLIDEVNQKSAQVIIIDGYGFSDELFKDLSSSKSVVVVLDDNGEHANKPCDAIVNQNLHASVSMYEGNSYCPELFLSPKFAIIRPEVKKKGGRSLNERRGLMIALGGTDTLQISERLADTFQVLTDEPIFRASGFINGSKNAAEELADAMRLSRAGIIALGTTTWEALYLGLPFVGLAVAENQLLTARKLQEYDLAEVIDATEFVPISEVHEALKRINALIDEVEIRVKAGRELVDGAGANRIVSGVGALCG